MVNPKIDCHSSIDPDILSVIHSAIREMTKYSLDVFNIMTRKIARKKGNPILSILNLKIFNLLRKYNTGNHILDGRMIAMVKCMINSLTGWQFEGYCWNSNMKNANNFPRDPSNEIQKWIVSIDMPFGYLKVIDITKVNDCRVAG